MGIWSGTPPIIVSYTWSLLKSRANYQRKRSRSDSWISLSLVGEDTRKNLEKEMYSKMSLADWL